MSRAVQLVAQGAGALVAVFARVPPEEQGEALPTVLATWQAPGIDDALVHRCLMFDPAQPRPAGDSVLMVRMLAQSGGQTYRLAMARAVGNTWRTEEMFTLRQLTQLIASTVHRETMVQALVEDRARIAGVLHNITDCWIQVDAGWHIVDRSEAAARFFKVPSDRLVGASLWQIAPGLLSGIAFDLLRNSANDGLILNFEDHLRDLDVWAEFHVYPRSHGLGIYFRDITARKRAEADLHKLAGFTEHHPTPVLEVDLAGRVRYLNQIASELAASVGGGDPTRLLPSHYRGVVASCLKRNLITRDVPSETSGQRWAWSFRPNPAGGSVFAYASAVPAA
ncbi:MAG: PAS domain-containing protein [Verrucomicrobia bacterium]|nr:PAS domain-containing protein [Verrucomicrobiota bacterium]